MQNSNLDIWAVQKNPNEIITALNNVKDSDDNYLYTNCLCNLEIGNSVIYAYFDTAFSSIKNDILILLMRNGYVESEDLKKLLDSKSITYKEIVSDTYQDDYRRKDTLKEIWFAREKNVLEDALISSKSNNINTCTYYPKVNSKLRLGTYKQGERRPVVFEQTKIEGMIELEDKIVLLINEKDPKNITMRDIFNLTENLNISTLVNTTTSYEVEKINNKEYVKK